MGNFFMKDIQMQKLIQAEVARQKRAVDLIASENYVSDDVLAALGSVFTNKYAEGYPGKRYYAGNGVVDELERLCQKRALGLFKLSAKNWAVNVQPYSGSPANIAIYSALVPKGGKIMGLRLKDGGHLTHGHAVSASGIWWKQVPFGVSKKDEQLDYDELMALGKREKPELIVAGFSAYSRIIDFKAFRKIADACSAILMVDMSHFAGLVAGGAYPSPFPYADVVMTTTHKTLRGPRGAMIFSRKAFAEKIDKAVFPGFQGGPHENAIAAIAVALAEAKAPEFKSYARQIVKNAKTLAKELERLGWRVISGGTDTHLFLVDTWMDGGGMGGKEAEQRLEKEGIIVNANAIPFDTRTPFDPSGIRLGTPAETTRGKKEKDMVAIARRIDSILRRKTAKK